MSAFALSVFAPRLARVETEVGDAPYLRLEIQDAPRVTCVVGRNDFGDGHGRCLA